MNRYVRAIIFLFVCLVFCATGLYFGYNKFKKPVENNDFILETEYAENEPVYNPITAAVNDVNSSIKINIDTEIVYEYVHKEDKSVSVKKDNTPYFLVNKTLEEISYLFSSWDIIKFEQDEIILRKEINTTSTQKYIISVLDGYVAVFYDEALDGNRLKEVTEMPINTLPQEDIDRLLIGIKATGEDELIRLLEDYSS